VRKLLVANRGEIAVRVIRACRELGVDTVAVYADCDRASLHVRLADEAWPLEGNAALDTYLRVDKLLNIVRLSGADAVHPGYGFLAEHSGFAAACREAGVVYVGPSARAIEIMGSKTAARATAVAAGVPVVPGSDGPIAPDVADSHVGRQAQAVGYPLLIKAVAGGGGKGMRLVGAESEIRNALRAARSEALSAFGDNHVYLERYISQPRHVEVQLLGDSRGTIVPFVERDCSIQRRHQKVVEESPSPAVGPTLRRELAEAAVRVAKQVEYSNAGTIEFLVEPSGAFYFLEMNTRLQVEHPITEAVTGIDLVQWQIRLADGESLTIDPEVALTPRGHAIELRIYAEDPDNGFLPSPGHVTHLRAPAGPGIRDDSGLDAPGVVPVYYDPLISKLVAWGDSRDLAVARLARALREYEIDGVQTTLPFFRWLLAQDDFARAAVDTAWLDRIMIARNGEPFHPIDDETARIAAVAVAIATHARTNAGPPLQSGSDTNTSGSTDSWTLTARREALR
jgi:acetyl-CoA carboxylase biotin carboxylase subunit